MNQHNFDSLINLKLRKLIYPRAYSKKTRLILYPESGFEARYERLLIVWDVKNAYSFGLILKDGHWGFQLISIRAAIRDFKAGTAPVSYFFSLCTPDKYLSLSQAMALAIVRGF